MRRGGGDEFDPQHVHFVLASFFVRKKRIKKYPTPPPSPGPVDDFWNDPEVTHGSGGFGEAFPSILKKKIIFDLVEIRTRYITPMGHSGNH